MVAAGSSMMAIAVGGKEGMLPGAAGQRYYRVPFMAAVTVAPLLGGFSMVLMPLVRFVLWFQRLARLPLAVGKARARGEGTELTGKEEKSAKEIGETRPGIDG